MQETMVKKLELALKCSCAQLEAIGQPVILTYIDKRSGHISVIHMGKPDANDLYQSFMDIANKIGGE
jgi:hypothetical protein